jgi:hypothetical protein
MIAINKTTFEQMTGNINNYSKLSYVKYDGVIPKCDVKYMKWNTDYSLISEMTIGEKSAVDEVLLNIAKTAKIAQIESDGEKYELALYDAKKQRRAILDIYGDVKKAELKKRMEDADYEMELKIGLVNSAQTIEAIELINFEI